MGSCLHGAKVAERYGPEAAAYGDLARAVLLKLLGAGRAAQQKVAKIVHCGEIQRRSLEVASRPFSLPSALLTRSAVMFRKIRSEGLVFGQMLKIQELIWQSDCGRQSALTIFVWGSIMQFVDKQALASSGKNLRVPMTLS